MDREISTSEQSTSRYKKLLPYLLLIGILFIAYYGFRHLITKSADATELSIATVEQGTLKATISASGTVIAAAERVINAPVTTEIKMVHLQIGAAVSANDLIMNLEDEYTVLEYEQLEDELALRKNNIHKLSLQFDKNLIDLDYQDQVKALQLSELEAQLVDQQRLLTIGGATQEEVEGAALKLSIAKIEKKQLENELSYQKSINKTEKENLQLEFDIQAKRLKELRKKLAKTNVKAIEDGVITWINEDIGKTVNQGEPLVKIANLDRYKIEGTTSDRNAKALQVGMPVEVRIAKDRLAGTVTRILPEIINNTIRFYVQLDDSSNKNLRPNLRTELYIINQEKENVLKAKRGNALKGNKTQNIFKVEGNTARKIKITKGIVANDYFEIEQGLEKGDRIIISDTKDYEHMDAFEINK